MYSTNIEVPVPGHMEVQSTFQQPFLCKIHFFLWPQPVVLWSSY